MNAQPVVVGIDPSARKLVAVVGQAGSKVADLRVMTKKLGEGDITARAAHAVEWTEGVFDVALESGTEVWIGVESPVLGRGGAMSTIQQAILHGALLGGFSVYEGVTMMQVNNSRWKKQTVGNGNANKEAIAAWAEQHFPEYVNRTRSRTGALDQDAIDALGIWHSVELAANVRRGSRHIKTLKVRRQRVGGLQ